MGLSLSLNAESAIQFMAKLFRQSKWVATGEGMSNSGRRESKERGPRKQEDERGDSRKGEVASYRLRRVHSQLELGVKVFEKEEKLRRKKEEEILNTN